MLGKGLRKCKAICSFDDRWGAVVSRVASELCPKFACHSVTFLAPFNVSFCSVIQRLNVFINIKMQIANYISNWRFFSIIIYLFYWCVCMGGGVGVV